MQIQPLLSIRKFVNVTGSYCLHEQQDSRIVPVDSLAAPGRGRLGASRVPPPMSVPPGSALGSWFLLQDLDLRGTWYPCSHNQSQL